MENLPQFVGRTAASPGAAGALSSHDRKLASLEQLVLDISNRDLRENAIFELSRKRELREDIARLLWHSFGTIAILIQEIVSIYPHLLPPNLTHAQSDRVCNSIVLLQCVASQPNTKMLFLKAQMLLYLYPFLNTTSKSRPFERLRLTSLTLITTLVRVDETEVISSVLSTEVIPLCLRSMEIGSGLSKTVAAYTVQKILSNDFGLNYICSTAERFFAVGQGLRDITTVLEGHHSPRLLKYIIRSYLRLSEHPRACAALRICLPGSLSDGTFTNSLIEDPSILSLLQQLLRNISQVPAR